MRKYHLPQTSTPFFLLFPLAINETSRPGQTLTSVTASENTQLISLELGRWQKEVQMRSVHLQQFFVLLASSSKLRSPG